MLKGFIDALINCLSIAIALMLHCKAYDMKRRSSIIFSLKFEGLGRYIELIVVFCDAIKNIEI